MKWTEQTEVDKIGSNRLNMIKVDYIIPKWTEQDQSGQNKTKQNQSGLKQNRLNSTDVN